LIYHIPHFVGKEQRIPGLLCRQNRPHIIPALRRRYLRGAVKAATGLNGDGGETEGAFFGSWLGPGFFFKPNSLVTARIPKIFQKIYYFPQFMALST
jgi:hypothetical protein